MKNINECKTNEDLIEIGQLLGISVEPMKEMIEEMYKDTPINEYYSHKKNLDDVSFQRLKDKLIHKNYSSDAIIMIRKKDLERAMFYSDVSSKKIDILWKKLKNQKGIDDEIILEDSDIKGYIQEDN